MKLLQKRSVKINNKGITLISLVVTIIILLILVGVALKLTLGENGIFNRAQDSTERYEIAQILEKNGIDKSKCILW